MQGPWLQEAVTRHTYKYGLLFKDMNEFDCCRILGYKEELVAKLGSKYGVVMNERKAGAGA